MNPLSYILLPIVFVTTLCIQPLIDSADHLYSCKVSRISAGNITRDVLVCVDVLEEVK